MTKKADDVETLTAAYEEALSAFRDGSGGKAEVADLGARLFEARTAERTKQGRTGAPAVTITTEE